MELQEFPIGKKEFTFTSHFSYLSLLTKVDLVEKIQALTDELNKVDPDQWSPMRTAIESVSRYGKNLLISGDDKGNPVYLLSGTNALNQYSDSIYPIQVSKATKYQRSSEYTMLGDFPKLPDSLVSFIQGNVKKDIPSKIILHNMPYEGPLDKSDKFKEVNKLITTKVKELSGKIKMTAVISGGNEIQLPGSMSGWKASNADAAEDMLPRFIRYMDGTSTFEDELEVARTLGVVESHWRTGRDKLVLTEKRPKIPTSIRTRLYYLMGAYQLPENWEDWFDD